MGLKMSVSPTEQGVDSSKLQTKHYKSWHELSHALSNVGVGHEMLRKPRRHWTLTVGTPCARPGFQVSSCKPLDSGPTDNCCPALPALPVIQLLAFADVVRNIPETEWEKLYAMLFRSQLFQREANVSVWSREFRRQSFRGGWPVCVEAHRDLFLKKIEIQ